MAEGAIRESTREWVLKTIFEAGEYFEVLILGVTIDEQPGGLMAVIDVECELGEKSAGLSFHETPVGFEGAQLRIRRIVGDWTK